jgi:hypothetical protein
MATNSASLHSPSLERGAHTPWQAGTYLTDGARLFCVVRVDAEGAEVEDARTQQLEWHPVRQLADATRAVKPHAIP